MRELQAAKWYILISHWHWPGWYYLGELPPAVCPKFNGIQFNGRIDPDIWAMHLWMIIYPSHTEHHTANTSLSVACICYLWSHSQYHA